MEIKYALNKKFGCIQININNTELDEVEKLVAKAKDKLLTKVNTINVSVYIDTDNVTDILGGE